MGDAGADVRRGEFEVADGAEEGGDVEVEDLLGGGGRSGVVADEDAAAAAGFGPAVGFELAVAGADGVGMDGEAAGELASTGQTVAGLEVAGEDGERDLGDELAGRAGCRCGERSRGA